MGIFNAIIGIVAALTVYQWGTELWRAELKQTSGQHRWMAAFMWISGLNFILRAIEDAVKFIAG